jgi:hypothetical protein
VPLLICGWEQWGYRGPSIRTPELPDSRTPGHAVRVCRGASGAARAIGRSGDREVGRSGGGVWLPYIQERIHLSAMGDISLEEARKAMIAKRFGGNEKGASTGGGGSVRRKKKGAHKSGGGNYQIASWLLIT